MNVLLLSMPDSFEHMPSVAVRMPNGALTSLAGNVDTHHRVAVADLVLVQGHVRETVEQLVAQHQPDIVGLSVMTFQRKTAMKIIDLVRQLNPSVRVAVGGYDPSLAADAYTDNDSGVVDFIVRGEGEITFRELLRAIEEERGFDHITGLSYRSGDRFYHTPDRAVNGLENGEIKLPNRGARVLNGYTILGRQVDVIETSRGCTFDCSFCSIIEMRGRNFFTYSFDRVIADIRDAYDRGARAIFIVDDNVVLNVKRFEALCQAIIDAGLNDIDYTVQAMTSAIANHGETLAPLMRKAGFRYVFLGIENILEDDLQFLKASSKNTKRENGQKAGNATLKAIDYIHRNKMYVVGGLIVGNPEQHYRVNSNQSRVRQKVHRLALHPAPDSLSAHADDQGVSRPRSDNQRTPRRVRWHDSRSKNGTRVRRRSRVHAMEGRALDESPAHPGGVSSQPDVRFEERPEDVRTHLQRQHGQELLGLEDEREAFQRYREIRKAERAYI